MTDSGGPQLRWYTGLWILVVPVVVIAGGAALVFCLDTKTHAAWWSALKTAVLLLSLAMTWLGRYRRKRRTVAARDLPAGPAEEDE